ncbi:MAG TPA: YceD family protein [Steroidobacteraceae bacterium]|nr:YceD family protein [Steroidobacteraceae bacterium]
MSSGRPPIVDSVDALVLAARNEELSRSFRIGDMPRLAENSTDNDSQASLHASFHLIDGRCGVAGQVTAKLRATCQRCLRPTEIAVDDRFHVVVVSSEEEMRELPDEQDSIVANAEHLDLVWMTEEQLLLAMPLVPLHAKIEECGLQAEQEAPVQIAEKQTPFANLRELMSKQ